MDSFYGFKQNQFQTFDKKGKRIIVTRVKTLPLSIIRIKTEKKDKYNAYLIGIGSKKHANKALLGVLKKVKSSVKTISGKVKKEHKIPRFVKEIKFKGEAKLKIGQKIKLSDIFQENDVVQVRGTTKGRGFAGVIKRWGFHGGPRTHGQSDRERAPGSIGQRTDPGRVWKGKKMPGHMGNVKKTIKGLRIFKIDEAEKETLITGLIPGKGNGLVKITKNKK